VASVRRDKGALPISALAERWPWHAPPQRGYGPGLSRALSRVPDACFCSPPYTTGLEAIVLLVRRRADDALHNTVSVLQPRAPVPPLQI